jgi:hypothetical protein
VCAVYFGARVAMAYGRDVRGAVFHHVGRLSAREVGKIGAPSLITRTTNDVQQVQMLVLMSVTMLVMAPIMCIGGIVMALREDLALSKLLLVCIPALAVSIGLIIGRMIPQFRAMQPKIDTVNRVLREHGLIAVRDEVGLEALDAGASAAFAVADHQVAHVYVNDRYRMFEVRALLERTPGVERVLGEAGKHEYRVGHARAGELIANIAGAPDESLARLEQAVRLGFNADDVRRDPEFANLLKDGRLQSIVSRH